MAEPPLSKTTEAVKDVAMIVEKKVEEQQKKKKKDDDAGTPSIVDSIWDKLEAVRHIFLGVFSAYLIGYMGLHISWSAVVFLLVYRLDAHYKKRGFARFYQMRQIEESRSQKVELDGNTPEWLNMLLSAVWPNISNKLALEVKRFMSSFIEDTLASNKPPNVHGVQVRDITMGTIPPQFTVIKPKKTEPNHYEMDFTLEYKGELEITIVATVGGDGIKVHVPVSLRHVRVKAEMRVGLEFYPEGSYLKRVRVAFTHMDPDWLDFSVKALGALNVLSVPGVKAWVIQTITAGIQGSMLVPKEINVNLSDEPDPVVDVVETKAEPEPARKPKKLKQGEKNPFKTYKGHVKVELIEAKNLRVTDGIMGGTDAYAKLRVGDVWFKSSTIKNTLDPVWNALYDFPLEVSAEDKTLQITIKDWDAAGRSDLQGDCTVLLSELPRGKTQNVEIPLVHAEHASKAKVHLALTFFPEIDI